MRVETLNPDQFNMWDTFVDQSPQGDVFCYSWWLNAITGSNFRILVLKESDEITAGIPLTFDENDKINVPPLTRTLGVLFRNQLYSSKQKQTSSERKWLSELLKHITPGDFVQICTHPNFTDWLPFRWKGFGQTTRYTYILYYGEKSLNDLWNNLDLENRRIIRSATKNGIRVEISDDFDLMYKYQSLSYERQGLSFGVPFNDLKRLDNAIKERGKRVIFKAVDNNDQVHAALYVAFNRKSAYALLSGSDSKLRKQGGHTLVMWEAIRYFIDKADNFNFGGSDIERIEAHLKGFGGTLTPYFHIYNEKLMWKRNDIRYHLGKISFHLREILKIGKSKLSKPFPHK